MGNVGIKIIAWKCKSLRADFMVQSGIFIEKLVILLQPMVNTDSSISLLLLEKGTDASYLPKYSISPRLLSNSS
jgi:hypothetical protein